jgi:hypothetical protein
MGKVQNCIILSTRRTGFNLETYPVMIQKTCISQQVAASHPGWRPPLPLWLAPAGSFTDTDHRSATIPHDTTDIHEVEADQPLDQ